MASSDTIKEDLIVKLLNSNQTGTKSNENAGAVEQNVEQNVDVLSNLTAEQIQMLSQLYAATAQNENEPKNFREFLPVPGFCLKTKSENNHKLFLNICSSDEINAPPDISEHDLLKLIDSEDSAFQYRVPMSLGEPHQVLDNSGCSCIAYDVCTSTKFLRKINENSTFMGFFMSVVLEGLENKYSIKIDRNCKMLKNKKFMGQIRSQYVRVKSKPIIAEVNEQSESEVDVAHAPAARQTPQSSQVPKYKIIREPADGEPTFLVAEIELPEIVFANSIWLDIGQDRILLNTRSGLYHLDIYLPFNLNQEECGAQFDKKSRVLTITMPISN